MRRPYIFLAPFLLGQCVDGSMPGSFTPAPNQRITINSAPVAPDSSYPTRRRIGALRFLGGWHLTSDARGFGGFSALHVKDNIITALSDGGVVVQFRLGRFGNASRASVIQLPPQCGQVETKEDNDTEALAHDDALQKWWVIYESRNAICRTNADFSVGEAIAKPSALALWPKKSGPESMTRLADGRFLVIAEDARDRSAVRPVIIFDRDPTDATAVATVLGYRAPAGFKPTEVAQLSDGRILVLNRRFSVPSLFSAELALLSPIAANPSGILEGKTIARFETPVIADNLEGMAVTTEQGKPVIWLISDDNFMRWQRTLLLKFVLD